jgi:hypothetical protein
MTTLPRTTTIALLLLMAVGADSRAETRQDHPREPGKANGIAVSTPAVSLPLNAKARLIILQAWPDKRSIPVQVHFKDAFGNLLERRRGVIGPNQPFIEELPRAALGARGDVLLQTRVLLGPVEHKGKRRSCPLHLTLEVVPEEGGSGSSNVCPGVDPCDDELQGPGARGTVFPFCVSRPTTLIDAD